MMALHKGSIIHAMESGIIIYKRTVCLWNYKGVRQKAKAGPNLCNCMVGSYASPPVCLGLWDLHACCAGHCNGTELSCAQSNCICAPPACIVHHGCTL